MLTRSSCERADFVKRLNLIFYLKYVVNAVFIEFSLLISLSITEKKILS